MAPLTDAGKQSVAIVDKYIYIYIHKLSPPWHMLVHKCVWCYITDCMRVPDCQTGCFSRLARLTLEPDCQIGTSPDWSCFLPKPLSKLWPSRAPDWDQCQIAADVYFGILRAVSRLIRLNLFSRCQIGNRLSSQIVPRQIARLGPPDWLPLASMTAPV